MAEIESTEATTINLHQPVAPRKRGRPDDDNNSEAAVRKKHQGDVSDRMTGPSVGCDMGAIEMGLPSTPRALTSSRPSSPSSPSTPSLLTFDRDASILLVGQSGAGKRSLGIMASLALRWRYIDYKIFFEKRLGVSPAQYLEQHGLAVYRQAELDMTERILRECAQKHVIGGLSELGVGPQLQLIRLFANTNPVIHVHRAKEDLRPFFSSHDSKFDQWCSYRQSFYNSCSNLDFYNISYSQVGQGSRPLPDTLKLKDTETDFIRFLRRAYGHPPQLMLSSDPYSSSYTYALQVPLSWLEAHPVYEELECGADAINFIVEPGNHETDISASVVKHMATLRRCTRAPIFFEPRSSSSDPQAYFAMLKLGARSLCDAIVIDLAADPSQIAAILQGHRPLSVIGTLHQPGPAIEGWNRISRSRLKAMATGLSCRAVRISHEPDSSSDNLQVVHWAKVGSRQLGIPLITYNTGPLGRTSVCFNPTLSPVTLPSMPTTGVTVKQAQSALYASFMLSKKKFTIFGRSVSYSLSPAMHGAAYDACGMPHSYGFVESDDFGAIREVFEEEGCGGVAVSLPYKREIMPILDSISNEAKDIGAVNTVVVDRIQHADGSSALFLKGFNTDHIGIRECIYRHLSPANSVKEGTSALIFGAGGMARAAIFACRTLGVQNICVHNRTLENAQKLAGQSTWLPTKIQVLKNLDEPWPDHLVQPTIIVSALPAHDIGGCPAHQMNVPEAWLRSPTGGVFIELAYKPLATRLIKQMQLMASQGWITVDGLSVLFEQGVAQFEIFTGRPAPVHVMKKAIRAQYHLVNLQD